MSNDKSLEEEVARIFQRYHHQAQERAQQKGQTERTSEDFKNNPIVKLAQVYGKWTQSYYGNYLDERMQQVAPVLHPIPYEYADIRKFHDIFPAGQDLSWLNDFPDRFYKDGVHYLGFLFALAANLKDTSGAESWFAPFLKPEKLLPQMIYLSRHSQKAKVKFKDLDTVVLTEGTTSLDEFDCDGCTLIVDCDTGNDYAGLHMKAGKIVLTKKAEVKRLGTHMYGGTLVYEGDLENVQIGERMNDGKIIVEGNVRGDSQIGEDMKLGEITIKGDYVGYGRPGYSERCLIGHGMSGGKVSIEKSVSGVCELGWNMSGGIIEVFKGIDGEEISIGYCLSGNSHIRVYSHCKAFRIGESMSNGIIEILGDASGRIGAFMKDGEIKIKGHAYQVNNSHYTLGSNMEGGIIRVGGNTGSAGFGMEKGTIYVGGNVEEAGQAMEGGIIHIGRYLTNKEYIMKIGGEIYERGVLVKPKIGLRLLGSFFKGMISLAEKKR